MAEEKGVKAGLSKCCDLSILRLPRPIRTFTDRSCQYQYWRLSRLHPRYQRGANKNDLGGLQDVLEFVLS